MHRRQFLKSAASIGAGTLILPRTKLFGADAPSNKLNIALIGTWGRGEAHFGPISSENVVALCDVDEEHLAFGARKFPKAKTYVDWRKCLDQKDVNAVVICTTDHGIAFPHMKCNLTDHGIAVMLIVRGPSGFSGGKVVDSMVSHLDIFPTVCELAGVEQPDWLRGKSLLPLVEGTSQAIHDELFFEVNFHAAYEPLRAVRTNRWKYIRRFDGRKIPVLVNCDAGESKSERLAQGWQARPVAEELLFDLWYDPNESNNLALESEQKPVLQEMRGRLERWMIATDDPLMSGPVPPPAGAKLNDPDDISPSQKKAI